MKSIIVGAVGIVASAALPFSVAEQHEPHHSYQRGGSFDNLYGSFPGAEGPADAGSNRHPRGSIRTASLYATLPPVIDTSQKEQGDARFPADLPNKPFDIGKYAAMDTMTGDPRPPLPHRADADRWRQDGQVRGRLRCRWVRNGLFAGSSMKLWAWQSTMRSPTTSSTRPRRLFPQPLLARLRLLAALRECARRPRRQARRQDREVQPGPDPGDAGSVYAVNTMAVRTGERSPTPRGGARAGACGRSATS